MRLSELQHTVTEAKKQRAPAAVVPPIATQGLAVEECPMYKESRDEKTAKHPELKQKIREFILAKEIAPTGQFGSVDKKSPAGTPFVTIAPDVKHAHLNSDISIWYKITGSNPTVLRLYGVFTHDETGTGQPNKIAKSRAVAKRMAQQSDKFSPAG